MRCTVLCYVQWIYELFSDDWWRSIYFSYQVEPHHFYWFDCFFKGRHRRLELIFRRIFGFDLFCLQFALGKKYSIEFNLLRKLISITYLKLFIKEFFFLIHFEILIFFVIFFLCFVVICKNSHIVHHLFTKKMQTVQVNFQQAMKISKTSKSPKLHKVEIALKLEQ